MELPPFCSSGEIGLEEEGKPPQSEQSVLANACGCITGELSKAKETVVPKGTEFSGRLASQRKVVENDTKSGGGCVR